MRSTGALLIGMLFLPGCELAYLASLGDDGSDSYDPYADGYGGTYGYGQGSVEIRNSQISGTIGHAREFQGGVWLEQGYDYGSQATVELHARNADSRWAVMNMVSISGGLSNAALTPGATLEFGNSYAYDASGMYVTVLGCAGPSDGDWNFDSSADRVTVQVQEGSEPGTQVLVYTATWNNSTDYSGDSLGTQTVTGSFEYRIPTGTDGSTAPSATPYPTAPPAYNTLVTVSGGHLAGNLGTAPSFSQDAWSQQGLDYGYSGSLELHAQNPAQGWAVMTRLDIQGGLASGALVPGSHYVFSATDYPTDGSQLYITAIGCEGASDGEWTFDESAAQVEVWVDNGTSAGTTKLSFAATFSGGQVVSGSLEYATSVTAY